MGSSEFAVRATVPVKVRAGRLVTVRGGLAYVDGTGDGLRYVGVGAQGPGLGDAVEQCAFTSAPTSTLRSVITSAKGAFTTRKAYI